MMRRKLCRSAVLILWSVPVWAQSASQNDSWKVPCPFDTTRALLPVVCGRLKVPENPQSPGRAVEIAFMRVTAPRSIDANGPIVFLNGGPGETSLYYVEQLVTHPHIRDVVADRDWIFFDQRGTGRSTPSLYCAPGPDWFTQVKACRDSLLARGVDLSQYNSARIAADMEALRAALPRLRRQPISAGDRTYDDAALLRFVRGWLYPRGYSTYEQRIQSLLVLMDAAARGDGRLMNDTRLRMRKEEDELAPRAEPAVPDHGRFSVGQNLSVYCNEKRPFESIEEMQRASQRSDVVRAMTQGFGGVDACSFWPAGKADPSVRSGVYDGPQLVFTGELDASSSGISGYEIAMRNPNARNVVFRNGVHGQFRNELPTAEDTDYRMCALRLARAFVADPRARLDTRCAETRPLRLVRQPLRVDP